MAGTLIDMVQEMVTGPAKRKVCGAGPGERKVMTAAELDALVAVPTTPIAFRAHAPTVVIVSRLLELQRITGHRNTRRDLDNRVAEGARMVVNIANAQRKIARWQKRRAELESLQPYDETARALLNEYQVASGIEWQMRADAVEGMEVEGAAEEMEVDDESA